MDIVTYALLKNNKLTQANSFGDFPIEGVSGALYLAKDTGQTYYWDTTTRGYIATGTSGNSGVIFVSNLPAIGREEILYILNNKIYAWKDATSNYYEIAGGGSGNIDWENYSA